MTMGVWQAELRNGGALDAAQRKFLRETYRSAGREEVFEGWEILLGDTPNIPFVYFLASVGRNFAILVREKMLTKPKGIEDDWGMRLLYQLYPRPWHRDMIRMSHSFQSYVRIRGRQHPPGRAWTPQAEHRRFKALAPDLHEPSAGDRKSIGTMT